MPSVLGTQENVNRVQEITLMMRLAKRNVNSAVKVLREVKGVIRAAVKGKTVFSSHHKGHVNARMVMNQSVKA